MLLPASLSKVLASSAATEAPASTSATAAANRRGGQAMVPSTPHALLCKKNNRASRLSAPAAREVEGRRGVGTAAGGSQSSSSRHTLRSSNHPSPPLYVPFSLLHSPIVLPPTIYHSLPLLFMLDEPFAGVRSNFNAIGSAAEVAWGAQAGVAFQRCRGREEKYE